MNARRTCRTAVRGTLGPTVGTSVVNTGRTRGATVRGTLGPTVSATVVDTRCAGRTAVGGTLVLVRILLGVGHRSS
ncbi:hypothetical protein ACWGIY_21310 [Streptomyces sp. NPDC054878]